VLNLKRDFVAEGGKGLASEANARDLELTVVVPIRNDRDNVPPLLDRLEDALEKVVWEVVFVDDDSRDGTADLLRSIAQGNVHVRCIQQVGRRGFSSACIEGILSSAAPFAAVLGAGSHQDEHLLSCMLEVAIAEDLDIVVAVPHSGRCSVDRDKTRHKVGTFARRLGRLILRADLTDPLSGFFLLRRTAFDGAVRRLSGQGDEILLDLFASAAEPLRFKELFSAHGERHGGEKEAGPIILEYLELLLAKTVGRFVPLSFLMFSLVGAFGVLTHMLVLAAALTVLPFIAAQSVATIVAMTGNFFVNNTVTFRNSRLQGRAWWRGLLSFYLICGLGAAVNIFVAATLFTAQGTSWWLSGLAGTVAGAVWNYAMASAFTWRSNSR
jgi:dolichol-phosphate mannosyltransferase